MKAEVKLFIDKMKNLNNIELIRIISNKTDYQQDAIEAAMIVALQRKIITVEQQEEYQKEMREEKKRDILELTNGEIKQGLLLFYLISFSFISAFAVAYFLDLDLDEEYVYYPIFIIMAFLFLTIPNIFKRKNVVMQSNSSKKYSLISIWIAEAFVEKENKNMSKFVSRRGIIIFFITAPCAIFNFSNNTTLFENEEVNVEKEYKPLDHYQDYMKEIQSMKDTVDFMSCILFSNEAETYFEKGKYDSALFFYKKIGNSKPNDSTLFNQIGLCYQKLNKKDSACLYFKKSMEMGYFQAKKNFNKNCK